MSAAAEDVNCGCYVVLARVAGVTGGKMVRYLYQNQAPLRSTWYFQAWIVPLGFPHAK
jgi:hypothetical protein